MIHDLKISIAAEADWRRVRSVRLAALQDTPDAFSSTFGDQSRQPPEWWQGRLRSPASTTLLAVVPGAGDAGMAVVADRDEPNTLGLYAVWVAPVHRGRGVGDALIVAAIDHARRLGALRLVLDVGITNPAAQRLYSRHGFVSTGRESTLPPPRQHMVDVEFVLDLA